MLARRIVFALSSKGTSRQRLPKMPSELIDDLQSVPDHRNIALPNETGPIPTELLQPAKFNISTTTSTGVYIGTSTSAFERNFKGLLIARGKIACSSAKILIDDGAEINYIDEEFCNHQNIPMKSTDHCAEMANGANQPLQELSKPIEVHPREYTEKLLFAVCPLKRYDAILGNQWLAAHNAHIFCRTNRIDFTHKEKGHSIIAGIPEHYPFVSSNTILNDFSKNHPLFAVVLTPSEDHPYSSLKTKTPSESKEILSEFRMFSLRNFQKDYLRREVMISK